jgi:DNA helicase-2/ATP-dependent DNA helicase PcrA
VEQTTLRRKDVEVKSDASEKNRQDTPQTTKLIDLAQRTLSESGLSVTALNHFLTCPNKFLYQSILKIPQAPSIPSEKGTAMHAALSDVWKSKDVVDSGEKGIEKILAGSITHFLEDSFLPLADKKAVEKELLESVALVATALLPHFKFGKEKNASVLTEHWVRTIFNSAKPELIPIHGKLDAIVDTGSEVFVFDYKTKQAMSVAEIKGETKNSNGDYFRQLVFYKMLLSSDPKWRTRRITPALVFVSPDEKGRCPTVSLPIDDTDIDVVKKDITTLIKSVQSGDIARTHCEDVMCEWCGLARLAKE